jgi:hypothetical protein
VGSLDNVYVKDGVMELRLPGGQKKGGEISAAEVSLVDVVTGGVFTMEAKLDGKKGTCQSIVSVLTRYGASNHLYRARRPSRVWSSPDMQFTYHQSEDSGNSDEQDIEILGSIGSDDGMPPAIELTNWSVRDLFRLSYINLQSLM